MEILTLIILDHLQWTTHTEPELLPLMEESQMEDMETLSILDSKIFKTGVDTKKLDLEEYLATEVTLMHITLDHLQWTTHTEQELLPLMEESRMEDMETHLILVYLSEIFYISIQLQI